MIDAAETTHDFSTKELINMLCDKEDMSSVLDSFEKDELVDYLKKHDALPETTFDQFSDDDVFAEAEERGGVFVEEDTSLQDPVCLDRAVDNARWGNKNECLHYLVQAVPELWPLTKMVG